MDVFPEGKFFEGKGALNKAKKEFKKQFKGLYSSEDDPKYSILVMDSVNKRYGFATLKTIYEHLHSKKDKRYSLCEVYAPAPYQKVFADIEVTDVDLDDFKNYMFKLLADFVKVHDVDYVVLSNHRDNKISYHIIFDLYVKRNTNKNALKMFFQQHTDSRVRTFYDKLTDQSVYRPNGSIRMSGAYKEKVLKPMGPKKSWIDFKKTVVGVYYKPKTFLTLKHKVPRNIKQYFVGSKDEDSLKNIIKKNFKFDVKNVRQKSDTLYSVELYHGEENNCPKSKDIIHKSNNAFIYLRDTGYYYDCHSTRCKHFMKEVFLCHNVKKTKQKQCPICKEYSQFLKVGKDKIKGVQIKCSKCEKLFYYDQYF